MINFPRQPLDLDLEVATPRDDFNCAKEHSAIEFGGMKSINKFL